MVEAALEQRVTNDCERLWRQQHDHEPRLAPITNRRHDRGANKGSSRLPGSGWESPE